MKISEFFKSGINPATAYILGLCFPLLKKKSLKDNQYFILGSVNHNSGQITDSELNSHFFDVSELFKEYLGQYNTDDLMMYNNTPIYGRIQAKEGFSVIMEIDIDNYDSQLFGMAKQVRNSKNNENKILFIRGCFDGRASFDTTAHYLSIDVDRNIARQDLIVDIIQSVGIKVNLNRRGDGSSKNDQIRIEPKSLERYAEVIGFYSVRRRSIVSKYLNSLI